MKTINEELKTWISDFDNGQRVKSVIMGGLGGGYEEAIQSCAIETMRLLCSKKIPLN